MSYRQRQTSVPGAVLWQNTVDPGPERELILSDGCMDVIWDGRRLFVAGPDSKARWHQVQARDCYTGIRLSGGLGPALLGVPADKLCDLYPDLDDIWPAAETRQLAERVAAQPEAALETWAFERSRAHPADPWGRRVLVMTEAGLPVPTMAERVGLSPRQLHRRCLATFGYGPRRLSRVLRMGRALDEARTGASLAQVAAGCGYFDQAHLCREIQELAGTTPSQLLGYFGLR